MREGGESRGRKEKREGGIGKRRRWRKGGERERRKKQVDEKNEKTSDRTG